MLSSFSKWTSIILYLQLHMVYLLRICLGSILVQRHCCHHLAQKLHPSKGVRKKDRERKNVIGRHRRHHRPVRLREAPRLAHLRADQREKGKRRAEEVEASHTSQGTERGTQFRHLVKGCRTAILNPWEHFHQ